MWEYKVEHTTTAGLNATLKTAGEDNWELVQIEWLTVMEVMCVFKRKVW